MATTTIVVKQGEVSKELLVPAGTTMGDLGPLIHEWEEANAFTWQAQLVEGTMLHVDGLEMPFQALANMETTMLSSIVGNATEVVLSLPMPVQVADPSVMLPVVSFMEANMDPISISATITSSELMAFLGTLYEGGNMQDCMLQLKTTTGSFMSIKLEVITGDEALLDYVKNRISGIPIEALRPPLPESLADLRLKLSVGMLPRNIGEAEDEHPLPNQQAAPLPDALSSDVFTKMAGYVANSQEKNSKVVQDGLRLLKVGNGQVMASFKGPADGKEKDKSHKEGSVNCTICNKRFHIGNGGTVRHTFGEEHLKAWLDADGNEELDITLEQLRSALPPHLCSGSKGADSRTKRTGQYQSAVTDKAQKRAQKAARDAIIQGLNTPPAMPNLG